MSWTTPEDILDRWVGSSAPTDEDLLQALINDAEAIILAEYPKIQERITDAELSLEVVKMVVSRMVTRVLRNPDMATYLQQVTGPFSQAKNFGTDSLDIWMTENEKQLLAPKRKGKAYEVDQGWNARPSIEDLIWLEVRK